MWQHNPVFLLNLAHAKNNLREQWARAFECAEPTLAKASPRTVSFRLAIGLLRHLNGALRRNFRPAPLGAPASDHQRFVSPADGR